MKKFLLDEHSEFWENQLVQIGIPFRILKNNDELADRKSIAAFIISNPHRTDIRTIKSRLSECKVFINNCNKVTRKIKNGRYSFLGEEYYFDSEISETACDQSLDVRDNYFPLKFNFDRVGEWVRKQFYYSRKELPTERVSRLNHFEIMRFTRNYLFELMNKNEIKLEVYSPLPEDKPLFVFRIDTDFSDLRKVKDLYHLCRKYMIPATWFCDVHSTKILEFYQQFEHQEIGLHCDRHYVYKGKQENLENITRALNRLADHKIYPSGFAAPFGDWNQNLESALIEKEFIYSSEFAFAYDSLPVIRQVGDKRILQIPIHPICPGRLRRSHFSEEESFDYYKILMDRGKQLNMPVIIYHHPGQGMISLIEKIFSYVQENGFNTLSMLNYACWWQKREEAIRHCVENDLLNLIEFSKLVNCYSRDHQKIYNKTWRWYLQEYESNRSRRYFKKFGYPKGGKS